LARHARDDGPPDRGEDRSERDARGVATIHSPSLRGMILRTERVARAPEIQVTIAARGRCSCWLPLTRSGEKRLTRSTLSQIATIAPIAPIIQSCFSFMSRFVLPRP